MKVLLKSVYELNKYLTDAGNIYVYGAGQFAQQIMNFLCYHGYKIKSILVTDTSANPAFFLETKVVSYESVRSSISKNDTLIVAINHGENILGSILEQDNWGTLLYSSELLIRDITDISWKELSEQEDLPCYIDAFYSGMETGFVMLKDRKDHPLARFLMIQDQQTLLDAIRSCNRRELSDMYGELSYIPASNRPGISRESGCMFVALSHVDKTNVETSDWDGYVRIQVGAALTDQVIAEVNDATGDNISERNTYYSECTAHYWIWKNCKDKEYVGLSHYRRQQWIDDEMILRMKAENIDILLSCPQYCGRPLHDFYLRYIEQKDWRTMEAILKEYDEEYAICLNSVKNGRYYFPCNIFFAKKDIYDNYCDFLFAITDRIEKHYRACGIEKAKRYMGYLTEILEAVYIMKSKNSLKSAWTDVIYSESR